MNAPPRPGRPWRHAFWLIMVLAALVRIAGIFGQGFPESFYPDETNAVQRSLQFGAERTLNPGWFNKPAFAYYLWFAAYAAFYGGGRLVGTFSSPEQFGIWAFSRVGPFLLIGRLVSTLFGIATVWLTYLIGKRLGNRTLGLVAAFSLAICYGHVSTGQWVKEDVPAAFFHTASTVLLVSVITQSRARDSAWSGFLGGLGMATKYYSAGLLIPAAFAHLFPAKNVERRMRWRVALFALFGALFLAGFFAGAPYNFISGDFLNRQVLPALKRAWKLLFGWVFGATFAQQVHRTAFVDSGNLNVLDVLGAVVDSLRAPTGLGEVFFWLAAGGGLLAFVRRRRLDVFMLVAVLGQACFLAFFNREPSEPRHLVVLFPLLAVWTAEAVTFVTGLLRPVLRRFSAAGVACALVLVAAIIPARGPSAGRMLAERSIEVFRGDTRLAALRWIEEHHEVIPDGAVILDDHEVLPLRVNEARADWALARLVDKGGRDIWKYARRWKFRKDAARDPFRPTYDVFVVEVPWGIESLETLEQLREGYDSTWPLEMEEFPREVKPVARFAEVPAEARSILESRPVDPAALERAWPASKWLIDGRPVAWLVSCETTYGNYADDPGDDVVAKARRAKRKHFPVRAAFYDDLAAHYECRQWSAGQGGKTGPTVRLYDLRRRVSESPRVVEMLDAPP